MIERLSRSLKYKCVSLNAFETGSEMRTGIGKWLTHYNVKRPHSTHGILTQDQAYASKDARRKLAVWRYDYNHVRPHSSLKNQTPADARRALEQFEGSAHDALAQTNDDEYPNQTRKLSV